MIPHLAGARKVGEFERRDRPVLFNATVFERILCRPSIEWQCLHRESV
jgi:hypothetical protein